MFRTSNLSGIDSTLEPSVWSTLPPDHALDLDDISLLVSHEAQRDYFAAHQPE